MRSAPGKTCRKINGVFDAVCFVDIDSSASGARKYTDVANQKVKQGATSREAYGLWLYGKIGSTIYSVALWPLLRQLYQRQPVTTTTP